MSEEKTEKVISKKHAEQIWEAMIELATKQSLYGPDVMATVLVNVRHMLDKAIKLPEKEDSKIDAAEKDGSGQFADLKRLIPHEIFQGFEKPTGTLEPCDPSKSTQQDSEDHRSPSSQESHTDSSDEHQASCQERNRSSIEDLQRDWRRRTKAYLLLLDLLDTNPALSSMNQPADANP